MCLSKPYVSWKTRVHFSCLQYMCQIHPSLEQLFVQFESDTLCKRRKHAVFLPSKGWKPGRRMYCELWSQSINKVTNKWSLTTTCLPWCCTPWPLIAPAQVMLGYCPLQCWSQHLHTPSCFSTLMWGRQVSLLQLGKPRHKGGDLYKVMQWMNL